MPNCSTSSDTACRKSWQKRKSRWRSDWPLDGRPSVCWPADWSGGDVKKQGAAGQPDRAFSFLRLFAGEASQKGCHRLLAVMQQGCGSMENTLPLIALAAYLCAWPRHPSLMGLRMLSIQIFYLAPYLA